jgi:ketosteroid isomerase-like protein
MSSSPAHVVHQLAQATSDHDLDGIVACFAEDYINETPAHPGRRFRGREQVRRNWTQILGGVPDIEARILGLAVDDATVWSEWEMSGTRRDATPHLMRGVIVFVVEDSLIRSARFYLEPVDGGPGTVDSFIDATVTPRSPGPPS